NVSDENAIVSITAHAAMLISYSDSARAEKMFLDLWKFSNDRTSKDFDKQKARVLILKYLYPRNSKLARKLMSEVLDKSNSSLSSVGLDNESSMPGDLALSLMDSDSTSAAWVLQQSLSRMVTPASVGALARLRERDFLLSDYVAANAIDG